jgi:hypothetical protein
MASQSPDYQDDAPRQEKDYAQCHRAATRSQASRATGLLKQTVKKPRDTGTAERDKSP